MDFEHLLSPVRYLLDTCPAMSASALRTLRMYEAWWEHDGQAMSYAVDRAGTPHIRMFDRFGQRSDEILYISDYWRMLKEGYKAGIIWRVFEENSLIPFFLLDYVTCFYDIGVSCPYTVSLSTAVPLEKYGDATLHERYLTPLLRRDESVWQGATWMTEARGGSDLGANVDTLAQKGDDGRWYLTGDKYFCSNAGAEVAVVAARVGETAGVRGLALFLVPRYRDNGQLNYHLRRLKDKIATRSVPTGEIELHASEAYLLGKAEHGIYLIMEVLNLSRVSNAIGSTALAQRAFAEALHFAQKRIVFGQPLLEQPLMRRQFDDKLADINRAFALAWEAAEMLNGVYRQTPPYSEQFHVCRLMIHLAKYWTAEVAVQTAKWAMEVNGAMGTLAEFPVERWLREAMIADIWEGPPHRQILDGMEVMERKGAHHRLFEMLETYTEPDLLQDMAARIDRWLYAPQEIREADAQKMFEALALFTGDALLAKQRAVALEKTLEGRHKG
ncbi:MAG: acyl-CoA dehydrogenase family protein [Chloroflexi bacterium]|nr:acyl-CoA dehydrogenase family protein [Chloroflexota bacterium]